MDLQFSVSNTFRVPSFAGIAKFSEYCPVRHQTAAERVRRRIADWVKREGHGSRKRLAEATRGLYGASRSPSWVTDILDGPDNGGQDLRLRDLDAIAAGMGVPPGDLVRQDDNLYAEVTPSEMRLLKFVRALPDVARHHFMGCLDYFSGMQQRALEQQAQERDDRTAEAKRARAQELRARKAVR